MPDIMMSILSSWKSRHPASTIVLPPSPPLSASRAEQPLNPDTAGNRRNRLHMMDITPEQTPSASGSRGSDSSSSGRQFGDSPVSMLPKSDTKERLGDKPITIQMKSSYAKNQDREAVLEDFQLIRVLGRGCAGRVLLVKHTATSAIHAMKAVSKRSVFAHNELHLVLTELRILKRFALEEPGNRFVVKLNYAFTDKENFYFVMDFYPGKCGDLATQLEYYGILGHHRTRFYTVDIVQGLECLHRHGIILRDLKPENVLLNSTGHAVLADFGLSKEFGYRGPPEAVHVPWYPGQPVLPVWAGAGAGSWRVDHHGVERLVVDRSQSFVGTCEYLAPEVVWGGEHSYALDFWALGCIVVESLVGRVPFRKVDEEDILELWNKIVSDDWQLLFDDPNMASSNPKDYDIDAPTWELIDALLQKDPMRRLTEPFIKAHPYFHDIDWDTVRSGGYKDPHGLFLDPIPELNTQYFPTLCLKQTPTVDMRGHDERDALHANASTNVNAGDTWKKTVLNDNETYEWELAKHKLELREFSFVAPVPVTEMEGVNGATSILEVTEEEGRIPDIDVHCDPPQDVQVDPRASFSAVDAPTKQGKITSSDDEDPGIAHEDDQADTPAALSTSGNQPMKRIDDQEAIREGKPKAQAALPAVQRPTKRSWMTELPGVPPKARHPPAPASIPDLHLDRPPLTPAASLSRLPPSASEPVAIGKPGKPKQKPKRIPLLPKLPVGLPSGGLSVSDIVSVPSPGMGIGSPNLLVRRHLPRASIDAESASIDVGRLSVELPSGRISDLGDEDWEELDTDWVPTIPSLSNAPSSLALFRNRGLGMGMGSVLKRRPSNFILATSGLRRPAKASMSNTSDDIPSSQPPTPVQSSRESSPTKGQGRQLFSVSVQGTKRVLGKFAAFPKHRTAKASNANSAYGGVALPLRMPKKKDGQGNAVGLPHPTTGWTPGFTVDSKPHVEELSGPPPVYRPKVDRRHTAAADGRAGKAE